MILQSLTFYLGVDQEKKKAGRPPKVSDLQLCALFILSYITNTPVFTLAKSLIDPNIRRCKFTDKAFQPNVFTRRINNPYEVFDLKEITIPFDEHAF